MWTWRAFHFGPWGLVRGRALDTAAFCSPAGVLVKDSLTGEPDAVPSGGSLKTVVAVILAGAAVGSAGRASGWI